MKQIVIFFLFAAVSCFASNENKKYTEGKISNPITFIENKGQVCDQNNLGRPDVLFSGTDDKLVYHIKNNGISYQLTKVESRRTQDREKSIKVMTSFTEKVPDSFSIYRVDISWLNANKRPQVQMEDLLPGYNNYYLQHCPDGVLNVQSYKGIVLKNLYTGIDLHYYEKEACLKYDFIVAANTDYKKILLNIEGAEIKMQEDGSILLKTPFGDVQEGKPIAFQNGKKLDAKWIINGSVLSFEIADADPSSELIIDPPTRVWGTFYGGTGNDQGLNSTTDNLGNVFIVGSTASGGSIATSGAHQTAYGGFISDGFLAKFNSSGIRQWATFYGGSGEDVIRSADTDNSGNIYVVGNTSTSSGSVIATPGAFQSTGGVNFDGFLVKFNSSGVRQWGTYYGSSTQDYIWSCSVENTGNIYISGITSSSGNYFATAGALQSSHAGGTWDAFLAKFNSSGNRIWGTYYGAPGDDQSYSCECDNKGHVYLSGYTSNGTPFFVTAGAHQVSFGGNQDGFLAKFDTSGVRVWGTFYGGSGDDYGTRCVTDTSGNIFLIGHTAGGATVTITTPGAYQNAYGGGTSDAFCAKFDAAGTRQWGTFYGGAGVDYAYGATTDVSGNIYITGQTSSSVSASIASPGAYQSVYGGGGTDAFFAKLDASGVRQWGSYYGGNAGDIAYNSSLDPTSNLYITGYSASTNTSAISTPGSHQTGINGNNDAFLVKFDQCGVPVTGTVSGAASFCGSPGSPQTYSISPISGASVYTWSFSPGWTGSSSTNSITLNNITANGYVYVSATNSCGIGPVSALNVSVSPIPFISLSSGSVCAGNNFTLIPSGASTYTFSSGSAIVSPTANTSYSVTGTNSAGCVSSNTAVATITVINIPTITVTSSSSVICSGSSVLISASGASSYTFIPGGTGPAHNYTPLSSTSYTIIGSNGVICKDTKTISITVNPSPTITAVSSSICAGQTATITASGASGYTLYPGGTSGATQTVSPMASTVYSIVGTSSLNCSGTKTVSITVDPNPTVSIVSSNSIICTGQTATLTANGASTYTWNTSTISPSIIIAPSVTTTYSVTGTSSSGCTNFSSYTQSVSLCTGIESLDPLSNVILSVLPNPSDGEFTIVSSVNIDLVLINELGQTIKIIQLSEVNDRSIKMNGLNNGMYFIIARNEGVSVRKKIIVSN